MAVSLIGGENHRPVAHWQTLSHNVVHLALIEIRTHNILWNTLMYEIKKKLYLNIACVNYILRLHIFYKAGGPKFSQKKSSSII